MNKRPEQTQQPGKRGNPFPGLRPFTLEESALFFGREGQSKQVLESLLKNRFIAVVGASGSGKSSLIYCGVLPEVLASGAADWTYLAMRPGSGPLQNLVAAFSKSFGKLEKTADLESGAVGMEAWLQANNLSDRSILLVVDQFEELFRYAGKEEEEGLAAERDRFVELLYDGCTSGSSKLHVVTTMRSDFIGECSVYQDLTDLINRSNYLIPQMTREDFRKAIVGPVGIGGAHVDEPLVEQLLNEIGEDTDQLPVLQHALMRTWDYWKLQDDPEKPIVTGDYEAIGRMEKALSDHANEAFDELGERQRAICESMFKTLTEKGGDNRGVRRPNSIEKIAEIAVCDVEEVIEVAEVFRSGGRTFLTPYQPVKLTAGTILDISHESLMRIWDRLRLWVDEEAASVQMYNRLSESSRLFQEGRSGLWRPPDLQLALNWREKQNPTVTWALQYNPAFERTIEFLETSDREFRKEEENKIRLQRRRLRVTRSFALVLGCIAVIAVGLFLWTRDLQSKAVAAAEEADTERKEAELQRAIADSSALVAQQQSEIARLAAEEAEKQREAAEEALAEARYQSRIAERRRLEAETASNLAEERRQEAETNLERAIEQEELARKNAEEAEQRRMRSIAKSMAVKSRQIDDDNDLKALLALQAYQYNETYGDTLQEADIYAGLYNARKALFGPDYNVFHGHSQAVNDIVFKAGSDTFYTAGSDGRVLRYALSDTSKSFVEMMNGAGIVSALALDRDGRWLAAGTDSRGILIIDTEQPEAPPGTVMVHGGRIRSIQWVPGSGSLISIGLDRTIMRSSMDGSREPELLASSESKYTGIAISPDGALVAASDRSGRIYIYSDNEAEPLVVQGNSAAPVFSLDFSHDGRYLAAGDLNGNVRLFETGGFTLVNSLRGNKARVQDLKFSPNDLYLASSGYDGKVLLWEMKDLTNSPVEMDDNRGFALSVAFCPDERYLVSGSSESSRLLARPLKAEFLVEGMCSRVTRNLTTEEWNIYVGQDIDLIETCPIQLSAK